MDIIIVGGYILAALTVVGMLTTPVREYGIIRPMITTPVAVLLAFLVIPLAGYLTFAALVGYRIYDRERINLLKRIYRVNRSESLDSLYYELERARNERQKRLERNAGIT